MKATTVYISAAALVLAASGFAGGLWWARRGSPSLFAGAQHLHAYSCPMHPQYRSDRPGTCPMCGMQLVSLRDMSASSSDGRDDAGRFDPGRLQISDDRQQETGVRIGRAQRVAGMRTLRTTGRVAAREDAVYPIVAGASGWIRDVGPATSGSHVSKHEVLATFYAPEFASVQQSYYAALETVERANAQQLVDFNRARLAEGVERIANTLRDLGVSDAQLATMAKRRELVQDIHVSSPVDGFVLRRGASPGLRFDRGFELYQIADLSRVWVLADVYQDQRPFIRREASARISTTQEHQELPATVSGAEPIFDAATLTLKVRLEMANPRFVLKPGMFVDVEFPVDLPVTLVAPADAIVDSGLRKTVFVDRGNGYFESRQVETGWRIGEDVEILKGLMAGERIVISGTFLIDSESRMKAAGHGDATATSTALDPVCGMRVSKSDRKNVPTAAYEGKTYYFCSQFCLKQFEGAPTRFVTR